MQQQQGGRVTGLVAATTALPGNFLWKEVMIDKLVRLFRETPCLYDANNDDYHNKDQKKISLEKIAEELGVSCKYNPSGSWQCSILPMVPSNTPWALAWPCCPLLYASQAKPGPSHTYPQGSCSRGLLKLS
jgi:hypothetical protein